MEICGICEFSCFVFFKFLFIYLFIFTESATETENKGFLEAAVTRLKNMKIPLGQRHKKLVQLHRPELKNVHFHSESSLDVKSIN